MPRADELISFVCKLSRNSEGLNFLEQKGLFRPVQKLLYLSHFVLKQSSSLYKGSSYIRMVYRVVTQYIFDKVVVRTQELYMVYSHLGINCYLRIHRYYKTQN